MDSSPNNVDDISCDTAILHLYLKDYFVRPVLKST